MFCGMRNTSKSDGLKSVELSDLMKMAAVHCRQQ